jgi:dipeptidyl-peptidase-4
MKKTALLIISLFLLLSLKAAGSISLKDIVDGRYSAQALHGVRPLNDGESFARISEDGKGIIKYSFKTGDQVGTLFDAATARGPKVKNIDDYILSPDESRILIQTETEPIYRHSKKAEYYLYSVQNKTLEQLSKNGKQQEPLFSPDGNQVAFVRDGNLFLVKLLFNNAESQVTKDGKMNEVINGLPDWVNEEEFSFNRAFDFSSDGTMLAWIRYDESKVPMFQIPLYKGLAPEKSQYADYPGTYDYKYPVAGAVNSTVGVYSYDIKSHVTRKLDLPLPADGYVPRIKFTATPDQLAVVTLNRHQSEMNIYMCNARSRVCKLALKESDEKYVKEDAYLALRFFGNHFLLISDRSGQRQLYWYTTTGQLEKQLTNGGFEVTQFYDYDEQSGTFYYQAEDGSPLRTAIFSTNLKGKTKKLSTQSGSNAAIFSTGGKYFLNTYSNLTTPPVTSICNNEGKTEKVLITNEQLKQTLQGADIAQKEFFTFKTSDGIELNGWMMKPSDFNSNKKYPVILYQYSGPGSQEVHDSWNAGFMPGGLFESYLCQQGFIVVCVDGRGTGGKGAAFEKCTYLHLGYYESHDQVETAEYVGTLPYVDKNNIGIWGWSYGGFNTLMSLSEGKPVFKAGVAVAPVTNYRFYDSIYTERYMRTPNENPDGYDYNAISRADKMHGDLLICHGLADDNVHFSNTAEYAEALVQANKQFDMQVYTNRNHSIYGGNTRLHLFTRISNFFMTHLK